VLNSYQLNENNIHGFYAGGIIMNHPGDVKHCVAWPRNSMSRMKCIGASC
jgi:hypothetical protein